ncbi:MAG TPA: PrsW family intramembrane metalloprotease, partial [Candidatus Dormibacteraeota bacterium]|nr:PrsW family intramembrane metalloprotease [Candidatus Dormibacteraeota bacterium]
MSERISDVPSQPGLEECHHCGARVPAGVFCGNCGAHLADTGGAERTHSFAAAPHEHVLRTAVVSTLFPHLPQRHAHVFREALVGGVLVVLLLGALRLYAPALLTAAVLLPVLYLLYLYEVEVYEHEPLLVLAATFVTGAAFGFAYTFVLGRLITATLTGTQQGPFITGVVLPVIAQLLMVAGPLLLIRRPHFDEVLDGLTFGVSAALGFTLAAVLTGYWHVLTAPLQSASLSAQEIAGLIRAALLAALVNASTTGMLTAALWQRVHRRAAGLHVHAWRDLPVVIVTAFGAQVALGLLAYYSGSLVMLVVIWLIAAAVLLVWLRVLLHHAL